ncbi:MAG: phosphate acyltransferase PlsX [Pseudomonadota bacterium]
MNITVAVDVMGGDFGPCITIPASIACLKKNPQLRISFVGDVDQINAQLNQHAYKDVSSRILFATPLEVPSHRANESGSPDYSSDSILQGIELLCESQADAFVSAGDTATLLTSSTFKLKRIPGVLRPAICSAVPSEQGLSLLLDVGANLECSAGNLHQFAIMGNVLAQSIFNTRSPRVALLNVGVEETKGTQKTKNAAELLERDSQLNYIGYIEGLNLFSGQADVVVCDGLTGNIALKAGEGAALLVTHTISKSVAMSKFKQLAAAFTASVFKDLTNKLNPQNFNGAVLLGVQGVVIKSHGHADMVGFKHAIERAMYAVEADLIGSIARHFSLASELTTHNNE